MPQRQAPLEPRRLSCRAEHDHRQQVAPARLVTAVPRAHLNDERVLICLPPHGRVQRDVRLGLLQVYTELSLVGAFVEEREAGAGESLQSMCSEVMGWVASAATAGSASNAPKATANSSASWPYVAYLSAVNTLKLAEVERWQAAEQERCARGDGSTWLSTYLVLLRWPRPSQSVPRAAVVQRKASAGRSP